MESTANEVKEKLLKNNFVPIKCLVWNENEKRVVKRVILVLPDNIFITEDGETYGHAELL